MRKVARAALTAMLVAAVPLAPAFAQTPSPSESPSASPSQSPAPPSLALSPDAVSALPATLNATVTGFGPGQTVTFRLDNSSVLGSQAIGESGEASTTITLPNGVSNGSHTIHALGDQGDAAAAPVSVDVPAPEKPGPSPEPTIPTPPPGGGGGGGGGDAGGKGDPRNKPDRNRPDRKSPRDRGAQQRRRNGRKLDATGKRLLKREADKARSNGTVTYETFNFGGAYSTVDLVERAARLRSLGWAENRVLATVFAPFIIAGEASWVNTWHAPRYGPAPGQTRYHEGQDVFCEYGAPVLASEPGVIEFDEQSLGGRIARLHRPDGSYFYYAHLAEWNTEDFKSGDEVRTGDVIGYCGNTGNAITTPPHVHFGLYGSDGRALNPMRYLVAWLRSAETNTRVVITRAVGDRVAEIENITAARRFGLAFAPDRSELDDTDALIASTVEAPEGAFSLVESALAVAAEGFLGDEERSSEGSQELPGPAAGETSDGVGKPNASTAGTDPAALP